MSRCSPPGPRPTCWTSYPACSARPATASGPCAPRSRHTPAAIAALLAARCRACAPSLRGLGPGGKPAVAAVHPASGAPRCRRSASCDIPAMLGQQVCGQSGQWCAQGFSKLPHASKVKFPDQPYNYVEKAGRLSSRAAAHYVCQHVCWSTAAAEARVLPDGVLCGVVIVYGEDALNLTLSNLPRSLCRSFRACPRRAWTCSTGCSRTTRRAG